MGGATLPIQNVSFWSGIRPLLLKKILKPIVTFLRSKGIRLVIYLDDILLLNSSQKEAEREFLVTTALLENCGFVINVEKSVNTPRQIIEFLGLIVDVRSVRFRVS